MLAVLATVAIWLLYILFAARAILRPHRNPASRFAWVLMMAILPGVGVIAYLLLGETNIGRRRMASLQNVLLRLPDLRDTPAATAIVAEAALPVRYGHLFQVGQAVNGFEALGGNQGELMADSNASIDAMVAAVTALLDRIAAHRRARRDAPPKAVV